MSQAKGEQEIHYDDMKERSGMSIVYYPLHEDLVSVRAVAKNNDPVAQADFSKNKIDEAHILYMESTELLRSRVALHENFEHIKPLVQKLFAAFRGEPVSYERQSASTVYPANELYANPGKQLAVDVRGVMYERLPVKTRLITMIDKNILPIIEEYAGPHLKTGDILCVSEKAVCITQGRVVDMGDIKPTWLARFLARNVGNYYGSSDFHGFGHGTALAMQLFAEEAGYPRILFAAFVSAITRPLGIRGMFYRICGKRAKSIDCPMSFLILEYAHAAKLAPLHPDQVAREIKDKFGCDVVIIDANYRGAFSLGKTSGTITEAFIGEAFRDNPAGQSDEMTPFVIVRKQKAAA